MSNTTNQLNVFPSGLGVGVHKVLFWWWWGGGEWNFRITSLRFLVFFFLYFSSIANVIALSILYVKHLNKHNSQQCNVKVILTKKE